MELQKQANDYYSKIQASISGELATGAESSPSQNILPNTPAPSILHLKSSDNEDPLLSVVFRQVIICFNAYMRPNTSARLETLPYWSISER